LLLAAAAFVGCRHVGCRSRRCVRAIPSRLSQFELRVAWRCVLLRISPRLKVANAVAGKESDSCCATERESRGAIVAKKWTLQRLNRSMLWVVTLIVLAFAFFPNYVGLLSSNTGQRNTVATRDGLDTVAIAIE